MKKIFAVFFFAICFSCTSGSDIQIFEKRGSKVFGKYIFEMDDQYFLSDPGDSSKISKVGLNKVFVNEDILFKRLNDLSAQVNGPFSLEVSNHESGHAEALNYDLKFKEGELLLRVFRTKKAPATYLIDLDRKYSELLKKAANNFAQKRGSQHRTSKTENTVTFAIRLNGRNFRRSKSIHDDDVLLLYAAIRFILTQNLKDKSNYEVIPDTLQVQTSGKYDGLRNPPLFK